MARRPSGSTRGNERRGRSPRGKKTFPALGVGAAVACLAAAAAAFYLAGSGEAPKRKHRESRMSPRGEADAADHRLRGNSTHPLSTPRGACESLLDAVKANDGGKVWALISKGSKGYYENMIKYARGAPGYSTDELHPIDGMTVQALRLQIPREKLASMDGRECFLYLSSAGHLNMEAFAAAPLARIEEAVGVRCKIWVKLQGNDFPLVFKKEGDSWRWDVSYMLVMVRMLYDTDMRKRLQEAGIPEP